MAWVQSLGHTERKKERPKFVELSSDLHTQMLWHMCAHTNTGIKHGRGLCRVSSLLVFHQELPSTHVWKASPSDLSTGIVNDILKRTSIAQGKRQIDNWNCMKLKSFALKKETEPAEREKIFVSYTSDRGSISRNMQQKRKTGKA